MNDFGFNDIGIDSNSEEDDGEEVDDRAGAQNDGKSAQHVKGLCNVFQNIHFFCESLKRYRQHSVD